MKPYRHEENFSTLRAVYGRQPSTAQRSEVLISAPRSIDFALIGHEIVARAAFPKGNPYLTLRDELGTVFEDSDFEELFSAITYGRLRQRARRVVHALRTQSRNLLTTVLEGKARCLRSAGGRRRVLSIGAFRSIRRR